jgi:hypothetical protein
VQKAPQRCCPVEQGRRFCRSWPALPARWPELLSILPHDRSGWFQPDADAATLIDIGTLGGNAPDNFLGGQYQCHVAATLSRGFADTAIFGVKRFSTASLQYSSRGTRDRAATLMLKRYGEKALEQSVTRADGLAADGDHDGAATWRRITAAIEQLANTTPPGPLH